MGVAERVSSLRTRTARAATNDAQNGGIMAPNTAVGRSKKRVHPSVSQDDRDSDTNAQNDESSNHSTAGEEVAVKHKRKRGHRKGSHTLRKEEIDRLRAEMTQLQSQMRELQQRAFTPKKRGDDDTEVCANVLHNVVKKQQNTFVDIQGAMSGYTACSIQCGSPIQRTLVLPNDELSRRANLRWMRTLKLHDASNFINQRLLHLNPLNAMSEEHRFENDDGEYWAVRFTTSQFESAQSVKQVFDLVVYFLSNSEISISEKVGHLTVREDDDNNEPGIAQHRLVSTTGKGLHMESNTVNFYECGGVGPGAYGLVASEFVDEDERHPYRPNTRIRKDANVVMEVRAYPRRCRGTEDRSSQFEEVVVLTLWSHSRLRRPSFPVPKDAWHELCESMDQWSQNMHKTILESLNPTI